MTRVALLVNMVVVSKTCWFVTNNALIESVVAFSTNVAVREVVIDWRSVVVWVLCCGCVC